MVLDFTRVNEQVHGRRTGKESSDRRDNPVHRVSDRVMVHVGEDLVTTDHVSLMSDDF